MASLNYTLKLTRPPMILNQIDKLVETKETADMMVLYASLCVSIGCHGNVQFLLKYSCCQRMYHNGEIQ